MDEMLNAFASAFINNIFHKIFVDSNLKIVTKHEKIPLLWSTLEVKLTLFFYKNTLYKNIKAQIG